MIGEPRVHGNGFIQVDLTSTRRLHIWGHPDIPAQRTPTPLHDHTFGFISRVLLGTMTNVKYTFKSNLNGDYVVHKVHVRDREDTVLRPVDERGCLFVESVRHWYCGQSYEMSPGEIHFSQPQGLCATIIEKVGLTLSQGGPSPRVFVPVGIEPDNTFHRYDLTSDRLWAIVADVLYTAPIR